MAADDEIEEARFRYRGASKRVYDSFCDELDRALEQIVEEPNRWPIRRSTVRYLPLDKFPYLILYDVGADKITVVAFSHASRRPWYWTKRLQGY